MFKKIGPSELKENAFQMIGKEWLLVSCGNQKQYNTMTASWGGIGVVWNKNVVTVYVRPQRYTFEFMEKYDHFSISVLPSAFKNELMYLGQVSGRDEDKISKCHLNPRFDDEIIGFEEARLNIKCKTLYHSFIQEEGFIDQVLKGKIYPQKDFHMMYIGEIEKIEIK